MQERPFPDKDVHQKLHARAEDLILYQSIGDSHQMAVITTSPDDVIVTLNRIAGNLLGYQASDLIGQCTPMIFHQKPDVAINGIGTDGNSRVQDPAVRQWHELYAGTTDCELVRKDGSAFPARLTVMPLRNDSGQITGYAGVFSDLSLKLKNADLASSEEKFQLLAENVPGVVYLCNNDETYSVIFINDQITTLTGYPKADFYSGKNSIAALFHPDDKEKIFDIINRSVAERQPYKLRYRVRHASGGWRWVDETGVGVYDGDKLILLEGFMLDITLQIEAEEKLWKALDENLRFFNSPVNLNAVTDLNGNLIRISPSWTEILGWNEEDLKSKPVFDFIHPDDITDTHNAFNNVRAMGNVTTIENRLRCKNGLYHWFLWALAAGVSHEIIYASAIDISVRKKSERTILESKSSLEGLTLQLQEQNRKLDEFAHIISHNLRAPVKNIQALINLLDERSAVADYQLIFEKLKKVAGNLGETMNELMDTLKAKTQQNVDLSEVRFKEVLDKVVQSLEGELIVARASVTFDFNDAPVIIYSKPYLESIFQNLLTNAIKYRSAERSPSIHFKSTLTDGHLELHVIDNGQGIDMEKFGDKLFGLHKTFHVHQEARGVGLFLVKTQIEALGGSIRVSSKVDKGTTFIIRFN